MANYKCERCHYFTQYKGDLKKHFEKKNECLPTHSTIDVKILLENLLQPKKYSCENCDKSFTHSRNLSRHIRTEHPSIFTNKSHNSETNNHSHNTTNTHSHNTEHSHNTNCHNNVNIHLNVFGKEELSHILEDEKFLTHCVRHITGQGLQKIINSIWCNKDVPENRNVELKRERKPRLVNVFVQDENGKRWVQKLADEVIDDMIQKGTGILQVHNNKLYRYDEDMTESDVERHDIRTDALSKIKSKSRGYAKKRDSVLVELKNHKNVRNNK